ncbi:hypothetical protein QFC24_003465 [Naganishia onofrii]|uniref:Uncharacterized protein n=1 Tax=Naganishia onofrii TaxID=1851511 RepID=A0ACC2XJ74_9TREE|nr:hypothetical protein QFC24_003465 [Naganishia onofrii]
MPGLHLFAAGSNGSAQLGVGHRTDLNQFAPCVFASAASFSEEDAPTITSLTSGAGHSLLLYSNGQVYITGTPTDGQLGPQLPPSSSSSTFTPGIIEKWTLLDLELLLTSAGLPVGVGIEYKAVHVGCSWTTSFICFSRYQSGSKEGSNVESRISDIILAFGTNDFGELGCGESNDDSEDGGGIGNEDTLFQQARVRIVRLPGWDDHLSLNSSRTIASGTASTGKDKDKKQRKKAGETLHILQLAVSQRHIVCLCLITLPSSGETEQRVYGWGAARHGQLSPQSAAPSSPPHSTNPNSHHSHPTPTSSSSGPSSSSALPRNADRRRPRSIYPPQYSSPVILSLPSSQPVPSSPLDTASPSPPSSTTPPTSKHHNTPKNAEQITQIAVGARHTIFLFSSGHILGLGDPTKSQLELPRGKYERVGCTWNGTIAVSSVLCSSKGQEEGWGQEMVVTTGSNTHGQLGRVSSPSTASTAVTGISSQRSSFSSPSAADAVIAAADLAAKQVLIASHQTTTTTITTTAAAGGTSHETRENAKPGKSRKVKKLVCGSEHVLLLLSSSSFSSLSSSLPAKGDEDVDSKPVTQPDNDNDHDHDGKDEEEQSSDNDDDDDQLLGWGWNEHGNLALGNAEDQSVPVRIPLPPAIEEDSSSQIGKRRRVRVRVRDVWAGCGTTWVLLEERS